jgi:hypothetical protein
VEKYDRAREGTDDNIMMRRKNAIFMHNDEEKKADTRSMIFNTYCLSKATVCIRTRLNVILYGFYQLERSMIFKFGRPSTYGDKKKMC